MILRSITQHVKDQNWFAVALDFFIVVLGVFFGLQVSNWGAENVDRERAKGYLVRLDADLGADIQNYRESIKIWRQVTAYSFTGLDYVKTGELGNETYWKILLAMYHASQVNGFWSTQTTYDELTGAGELKLINNTELRNKFANYYSTGDNPILSLFPKYRENVRGKVPLDIQNYIWENCYSTTKNEQLLIDCESPGEPARVANIVDQLAIDTVLMNELRFWVSNMRVAILISKGRIQQAEIMQRLIRS